MFNSSAPCQTRLNRFDWAIALALLVATLGVYGQTRSFEFLRFDDPQYVSQNWAVQSGLNLTSIRYAMTAVVSSNWHPLTLLVEMAAVQLLGSSSGVFHALCTSLHASNVILLFLFLRSTTGSRGASAMTAALWGLHPLRAESVAWVGELKDVLCGFWWLLTMLAFARYRQRSTVASYIAVFICAALAMLAKPMAVTLPAALFLLNFWPLRAGEIITQKGWVRRFIEQIPLVLLAIVISIVAVHTQSQTNATGSLSTFPFSLRITNALFSFARYVGKQLLPIHLGLIYPHPGMLGRTVPTIDWIAGAILLIVITIFACRTRRSKPYINIGWLWFIGCLIPVIGLVQVGQAAMADRYSYIPGIGFTFAIVYFISEWASKNRFRQIATGILTASLIIAMLITSTRQISFWKNNGDLMTHSNAVIPDDFLAKSSLSMDATANGNFADAIALAQSAVDLVPRNQEAHHALAMALAADNQTGPALKEYVNAIHLDPQHPGLRFELGRLLAQQNRMTDAIRQFQNALDLDPDYIQARHSLASAYAVQGKYDDAIAQWEIVVKQNPKFGPSQGLLADALRLRGDHLGAIEHYQAALANGETNWNWKTNLVWELAIDPATTTAQLQMIIPIAKQACDQTQNQRPFPLYAYSLVLARLKEFDQAIECANQALNLATSTHQTQMANAIRARIQAYQTGQIVKNP